MNPHWQHLYKALTDKNLFPAVTLQRALQFFEIEHLPEENETAIDLGCGKGIDKLYLLANKW